MGKKRISRFWKPGDLAALLEVTPGRVSQLIAEGYFRKLPDGTLDVTRCINTVAAKNAGRLNFRKTWEHYQENGTLDPTGWAFYNWLRYLVEDERASEHGE